MMVATQYAALPCRHFLSQATRHLSVRAASSVPMQPSIASPEEALIQEALQANNGSSSSSSSVSQFRFPKKGQQLEMECESLAFKGKGVCKVVDSGFIVLCERALPGERLLAQIIKKKGSYAEAIKLKTLSPHDHAVSPPCVYAADCGGCKMQNLAYEAQLAIKEKQVFELISRIGRFSSDYEFMKGIIGCESPFHYRNKMEFSFGTRKWTPKCDYESGSLQQQESSMDQFALGLHAPGRFDRVLNIEKCLLQEDKANVVLEMVHQYCSSRLLELPPYNTHKHTGFLKHLVIRSARDPNTQKLQLMVNFVTSKFEPSLLQPLVNKLVATVPEVNDISVCAHVTDPEMQQQQPTDDDDVVGSSGEGDTLSFRQQNVSDDSGQHKCKVCWLR